MADRLNREAPGFSQQNALIRPRSREPPLVRQKYNWTTRILYAPAYTKTPNAQPPNLYVPAHKDEGVTRVNSSVLQVTYYTCVRS
jgi:hypothetical protein